jgi:hypothetical protein
MKKPPEPAPLCRYERLSERENHRRTATKVVAGKAGAGDISGNGLCGDQFEAADGDREAAILLKIEPATHRLRR